MAKKQQPKTFAEVLGFTERQLEAKQALKDGARYLLYGGARGGGKSRFLRWILVNLLLRWYKTLGLKNVRVGLFCEDYPALYDRQLSKVEVEFPEEMGKFNREHKEFRLSPAYGSGVICFRNLDDPSKYMSAEFAAVAVDELTKNLIDVFNILRGSLRWPGIDDVRFLAASNPGEKGHLWVKQLFIDRIFPPELEPYADQFAYVKALPTDNPYNADSYIEMLKGLPPKTRKAWLEGNWDVFEGQVFEEWDAEVHVLEEFKPPTS